MRKPTPREIGLAATILLAPGGFILGATLAANHYRKLLRERNRPNGSDGDSGPPAGQRDRLR